MQKIGMFSFVRRTLLFVCLLYLFFFINIQPAFSQSTSLVDFTKKAFKAIIQEAAANGPVALCNSAPVPSLLCDFVLKPVVDILNKEYPTWHSNKKIALNAIDSDPDINNLIRGKLSQLESQHDEILRQLKKLGNNQQEMQTSLKRVLDKLDVIDAKLDVLLGKKEPQGGQCSYRFTGLGGLVGTYTGACIDGEAHGYGTANYDNGNIFQGEYRNGERNGQGTYTHADGTRHQGEFRDDKVWNATAYMATGLVCKWVNGKVDSCNLE